MSEIRDFAGSVPGGAANPRKNVLINGNFDIWQRGETFSSLSSSTTTYTVDRWSVTVGSNTTATVTQQGFGLGQTDIPNAPDYYLRIVTTGSGGSGNWLNQKIEDVETLSGEDVTLTFYAKASTGFTSNIYMYQNFAPGGSSQVQYSDSVTIGTAWAKYEITFSLSSVAGKSLGSGIGHYLQVQLPLGDPANTVEIAQVQLEKGNTSTDFDKRTVGEELALCQRYYYRWNAEAGSTIVGMLQAYSTASAYGKLFDLPVTMRILPTVSLSSVSHFRADRSTSVSGGNLSALGVIARTKDSIMATSSSGSSGLTAGDASMLRCDSGAWIDADAEI